MRGKKLNKRNVDRAIGELTTHVNNIVICLEQVKESFEMIDEDVIIHLRDNSYLPINTKTVCGVTINEDDVHDDDIIIDDREFITCTKCIEYSMD